METTVEVIKFIRTIGGYHRTVYVPRKVLYVSLLHGLEAVSKTYPGEMVVATIEDWVISVTSFKGKRYMCYTKMDQNGNRIE